MERGRGKVVSRNRFEILQGREDMDVDDEDEQQQQQKQQQKQQQQQEVIPTFFCKDGNEFQTALCTSHPSRVYFGIQSAQQLCRVEQFNTNNSHALISKKFHTTLSDWLRMNPPNKKFPLLFHNYPSTLVTAIIRALMLSYAQFRTNPKPSHKFLHLPQSYTLNIFSPNDPTNIPDLYCEYMRTVVVDIIHILPLHGEETKKISKKITETESIASLIFDQILAGKDSFGGSDWYEWSDFRKSLMNSHDLTYAVNHPVLLPWRKRLNLIDSLVMKLHSPNTQLKNLIRDVLADMEMFEQDWIDTIKDDAPFMSILNFHADAEVDTTSSSSKRYIKQRRGIRLLQLIRNSDHHLHDKKPLSEDPTGTEFKHFDKNQHPNYLDKRYICFKFLRYFPKLMPQLCSGLVKHNVKYWEFL